jgi:hypothetical protein
MPDVKIKIYVKQLIVTFLRAILIADCSHKKITVDETRPVRENTASRCWLRGQPSTPESEREVGVTTSTRRSLSLSAQNNVPVEGGKLHNIYELQLSAVPGHG